MQKYELKIPGWHTQGEIERKLLFANIGGIFATVAFGASGAPYIWHIIQWGASHLPAFQPALPFPSPLNALFNPNWLTGGIWLAYYFLLYAIALFNPKYHPISRELARYGAARPAYQQSIYNTTGEWDLQQKRQRRAEVLGPFLYRPVEDDSEDYEGFDSLFETRRPRSIPLSQAWPGEAKYELIER